MVAAPRVAMLTRVEPALKKSLERRAHENCRPLSHEIEYTLKKSLEESEREKQRA